MQSITIIGTGGHARAVYDAIRQCGEYDVIGLLSETMPIGDKFFGVPIVGDPNSELMVNLNPTIIAIGNNAIRERMSALGYFFVNAVHPTAQVGTTLCRGSFFGANSFVGPGCAVGNFAIVNTGAILEHDSTLGDYSNLCPGVVTGGRVKIGSRTTIGLGAVIREGVTIGNNVVVGMGAVVVCDIPDNESWFGVPAKLQFKN